MLGASRYDGVNVYNVQSGQLLKRLPAPFIPKMAWVAFSPDGRFLSMATIGSSGREDEPNSDARFWRISGSLP